jgi:hypothetical protein
MLAGWRLVLGLRLGPRSSPDHILGWRVTKQDSNETVCQAASPFLHATNTFERIDGRLVWSTYVTYDRRIARWSGRQCRSYTARSFVSLYGVRPAGTRDAEAQRCRSVRPDR